MKYKTDSHKTSIKYYSRHIGDQYDDIVLFFCTEVLGLNSLHWGYWKNSDSLTMENLKKAQREYSIQLSRYIPEGVKRILDVGCGIGDNAIFLSKLDYQLTCISPDINHEKIFNRLNNEKITFYLSTIEKFNTKEKFDLALLSESSNYFDIDIGFNRLNQLLSDEGYILSASLFRKKNTEIYKNFHIEDTWIDSAKDHGFEICTKVDITNKVIPTIKIGRYILENYIIPVNRFIVKYLENASEIRSRILSLLIKSNLQKINSHFTNGYISHITNDDLFKENATYMIYLLKKTSSLV